MFDIGNGNSVGLFAEENKVDKVNKITYAAYPGVFDDEDNEVKENTEKEYLIDVPSEIAGVLGVEEPEKLMEACYADMSGNSLLRGHATKDSISVECNSTYYDNVGAHYYVYFIPENAELN